MRRDTVTNILWPAIVALVSCVLIACTNDALTPERQRSIDGEVAKLRRQVDYLLDRQQIHDVYLRYSRGFDRNDVQLMRTAFWPDAQINYGKQSNTFEEFVNRHLHQHTRDLAHWAHLLVFP